MTRNPFERDTWEKLKKLSRRYKFIVDYESEFLPFVVPSKPRKYTPDFIITFDDQSRKIYIETKGYLRPADRLKLIAVRRCNPGIDLRLVFQKDQPISKKSKTMYSNWAEKNNFIYAIGSIPSEWFK